jgi:hypothetical protein
MRQPESNFGLYLPKNSLIWRKSPLWAEIAQAPADSTRSI